MGLSLEAASHWFDLSSIALAIGACIVFVSTAAIVWLGIVKEHHWDALREKANEETSRVNVEAGKAHERAAALENEAAQARADIARAHERAARAEQGAAEANARAAEANRKAEQERLERLKIQEKLAPRSLGAEQQAVIINELKPFAGTSIDMILFPDGNPDGLPITETLVSVLQRAGWVPRAWSVMGAGRSVRGILVRRVAGIEGDVEPAINALAESLAKQRLAAGKWEAIAPALDQVGGSGVTGGPWDAAKAAPIRLEIGIKP